MPLLAQYVDMTVVIHGVVCYTQSHSVNLQGSCLLLALRYLSHRFPAVYTEHSYG